MTRIAARIVASTALLSVMWVSGVPVHAQSDSLSVADRIAWEEALLALEEGDRDSALVLLDDLIAVAGPVPAVLFDAAWVSFEAEHYLRAEEYIMAVLETDDAAYRESEQYDDAFRLAARIQRALRPVRDSQIAATPLPYSDSLARMGFSREVRDRNGSCEWRFDRGGLLAKYRDRMTCMNGTAATTGRVRIGLTIERRGGGSKSSAGLIFGREDDQNYYFLRIHPRWSELGGDVSLISVDEGRETVVATQTVSDSRGRPLRSWSDDGPWRLAVEIRGRKVDWLLDNRLIGTASLDSEIRGEVMAGVGGPDSGEYVFTNLSIDDL